MPIPGGLRGAGLSGTGGSDGIDLASLSDFERQLYGCRSLKSGPIPAVDTEASLAVLDGLSDEQREAADAFTTAMAACSNFSCLQEANKLVRHPASTAWRGSGVLARLSLRHAACQPCCCVPMALLPRLAAPAPAAAGPRPVPLPALHAHRLPQVCHHQPVLVSLRDGAPAPLGWVLAVCTSLHAPCGSSQRPCPAYPCSHLIQHPQVQHPQLKASGSARVYSTRRRAAAWGFDFHAP